MPELHVLKKQNQPTMSSNRRAERKVAEFMQAIEKIVSRLNVPSRLPTGLISAWEEEQEREALQLSICFPNLSDAERSRILELGELRLIANYRKNTCDSVARIRPGYPSWIQLAVAAEEAETQYLAALRSFQESDVPSLLSAFQQQLLGWFVDIELLRSLNSERKSFE